MLWSLKDEGSVDFHDWNEKTRHPAQSLEITI
jgi:hypothetical protein